jgi:deazaflavin-dependent oxidoreductase (nitroreductase family)
MVVNLIEVRIMGRVIAMVIGAVVAVIVVLGAVFVVGMRARSKLVINGVRRMTHLTNRFPMKTAGVGDAYASVVGHVGRNSGKSYRTPVRAVATNDGFVIALPYGSTSDWVKNVLANGKATIEYAGDTYAVDQPRIVPLATTETLFSRRDQQAHQLFGVREALTVRRTKANETGRQVPTPRTVDREGSTTG